MTEESRKAILNLYWALLKLRNEADGFVKLADIDTHGITNIRVMRLRIEEAEAALDEYTQLQMKEGQKDAS